MENDDGDARDRMLDESFAHMALHLDIAKEAIKAKDYAEASVRFAAVTNMTEAIGIFLTRAAILIQGPGVMEARLCAMEAEIYANHAGHEKGLK